MEPAAAPRRFEPEPPRFRQVFGHFCTGITVITAVDDGEPVGFSCQSFAALSLEPPLVLFCPARASATWPRVRRAGYFCANVLGAGQQDLASRFGRSGPDKFAGVAWSPATTGAPVLHGALIWAGCEIEAVHPAGDHLVAIGRVLELGDCGSELPLLYYRSRYATLGTEDSQPDVVETLLSWPPQADWR
ncbi:MAG: 3-hydroxy-9,10-secoandrosta-1,3,5(10)-triene-9,17-dione monooxygenase reductase subunit [Streptosporangiaceae bacterium]|jgi:3-hydroxy-9,10-secoandrosta-1,3,5(10)-triene-9,17-dione monooxygenase reductase component